MRIQKLKKKERKKETEILELESVTNKKLNEAVEQKIWDGKRMNLI